MRAADRARRPAAEVVRLSWSGPEAEARARAAALALGADGLPVELQVQARRSDPLTVALLLPIAAAASLYLARELPRLVQGGLSAPFQDAALQVGDAPAIPLASASADTFGSGAPDPAPPATWDWFLAHAGPDADATTRLRDALRPHGRPFLDKEDLQLGDRWDEVLPEALRASAVTVVLVSARRGWYLADEVQAAIAYVRRWYPRRRVAPVWLEGRPADPFDVPYGLGVVQGVDGREPPAAVVAALCGARERTR
jgi:hypothetical protein